MVLRLQRKLRRWHRWLAIITAVQLLAWTLSGIFFAFIDIEFVRGADHRQPALQTPIDLSAASWITADATEVLIRNRLPDEVVVGVVGLEETRWYLPNGNVLPALTEIEALQLAGLKTDLNANRAVLITEAVVGSEYRGRALPLWRVFKDKNPSTVAYIDATSGELVAIRNTAWRWWDFLWSLHIMDYDDRDTIGTLLLKLFSVMSLLTAIAGIALFISLPKKWR
jgi:uncharacterized iron-regulated membrane protein